jgi:hypothetical protein
MAAALAIIHQFFQGCYQARGHGPLHQHGFRRRWGCRGSSYWLDVGPPRPGMTFTAGSAVALLALLIVATRLRLKQSAHAMGMTLRRSRVLPRGCEGTSTLCNNVWLKTGHFSCPRG